MAGKKLLLGNHALAEGALEAGIGFASGYPGTPSTEIIEYLAGQNVEGLHVEWSVNEKVALETAVGASYSGVRSLCAMKHVGLNVALDPLMTLAYTGVKAGLVIIVCDDPGMFSSQNGQDTRHLVRAAKIMCLEPKDGQQAKEMVVEAFELSEKLGIPVVVKSLTRLSHTTSPVVLGERKKPAAGTFKKDSASFVMIPQNARPRREILFEKQADILKACEESGFNKLTAIDEAKNNSRRGIIACGTSINLAQEHAKDVPLLECGTWPIPQKNVEEFVKGLDEVVLLEEGDPIVEEEVRVFHKNVLGKLTGHLPLYGELNPECLEVLFEINVPEVREFNHELLAPRPPVFCPGCPHRGTFYVLKKLGAEANMGDIGCYALGVQKPFEVLDTCLCMGAGIGQAAGASHVGVKKSLALIGDSTFLHSGITGLLNSAYNGADITIVIFDNGNIAMTGHQPTPLTGIRANGVKGKPANLSEICRACGAETVLEYDPRKLGETDSTLKKVLQENGVKVVIAKAPCTRIPDFKAGPTHYVDQQACVKCGKCLELGCPAIVKDDAGRITIDEVLCVGCTLCAQACSTGAIKTMGRAGNAVNTKTSLEGGK
ncbi:MAG TPA: indolepyruvate ferredoxin oxidoreductase subunit alpha [Candidatus Altiarchaeales archaeon]|nr:indolepyruvate ferredoxin oxidoreductase subunit alpha [Candidatus Altiarchaeales archaeon]